MRVTLQTKMLAGFAAVLLLTVISGGIGILGMGRVSGMMTSMYDDNLLPIQYLGAAGSSMERSRVYLMEALGTDDKTATADAEKKIADNDAAMMKSVEYYRKSKLGAEETGLLAKFDSSWKAYQEDRDSLLRLHREGKDQASISLALVSAREKLDT
ncbi:MAG TPA: MCP four helix bundle domain-containing protein, partial [Chloroflexota bacterium]|nr:MCP four helix bundle domain-containing protein [Chloroflexota bacterium]